MSLPDREEIYRSIYGAWRIARLDPGALRWFDVSADGFYRSFFVMALIAPFALLLLLVVYVADPMTLPGEFSDGVSPDIGLGPKEPGFAVFVVVQGLFYVLDWLGYAALMVPVTMLLGATGGYATYIVVWNWSHVLEVAVLLPATTFALGGLLPEPAAQGVVLLAVLAVLGYGFLVARAGLGCGPVQAIAVVVLHLLWDALMDQTAFSAVHALSG